MVVEAHRSLQPLLQLSTGRFRENVQVVGKGQEARCLRRQERQEHVVVGGVYTAMDRAHSLYDGVNYYQLEDWLGRRVKGRFYKPQLQKVKGLPNHWHVAKKLKHKGRGPRCKCW